MNEYWYIIGTIATGIGAIATAWMACQTFKSNQNAKEAILENKKDSFFNMIVAMNSNSRRSIEQLSINNEDCTTISKPFGLDCLKYIYEQLFKIRLVVKKDENQHLSEQKDEYVTPNKETVEEVFDNIINSRYPNIGTYLSSVTIIIELIDNEKSFGKEYKNKCIAYIKSQMTLYEKLWLYYYSLFGHDENGVLNKNGILSDIPNDKQIYFQ